MSRFFPLPNGWQGVRVRHVSAVMGVLLALVIALLPAAPAAARGLSVVAGGAAAFYGPAYDNGGWDKIIRAHIVSGQYDAATFPYDPQGFYCVHPDYAFGAILTVRNARTGRTGTCTVADTVALSDQPVWRARWAIEMSWAMFSWLGLDNGNQVEVLAGTG